MNEIVFDDMWVALKRKKSSLNSTVQLSKIVEEACSPFDFTQTEFSEFFPWEKPILPENWGIGVIVGASGSGKSLLLKEFGEIQIPEWKSNTSIIAHFDSSAEAVDLMYAVGLSSVPTWVKPFNVLSNGEQFRANLARSLKDNQVVDEFTSVVDRNVAQSASKTLKKYVAAREIKNLVFASCHRDILEWLEPDWIIDTDAGMFVINPRECLRQKSMVAEIYEVERTMWEHFKKHHYLSSDISPFSTCFIAVIQGIPVAFASAITFPSGTLTNAWRGHRLVTLPDFQGLGIGPRLSDWTASYFVRQGKRYFSKTAHPRLGLYRETSPLWKPTSKNGKLRTDAVLAENRKQNRFQNWVISPTRKVFSHEFIGE
jgi:ABC-type phosphate/phosphonate transport system ATPase subunit